MARNQTITLQTGTALAATATASPVSVVSFKEGNAALSVTAVTGTTPTADVIIEHSADGTVWFPHTTFTQATTTTTEFKAMANFMQFVRAKATIGGTTPEFTFTLKMTAKA